METQSPAPRSTASSTTGCLLIAVAFISAPFFLLFGTAGGSLNYILILAGAGVGGPRAYRAFKVADRRRRTWIAVSVIVILILFGIANGMVQSLSAK